MKCLLPLSILLASLETGAALGQALEPDGLEPTPLDAALDVPSGDDEGGPLVSTNQGILQGTQAGPGGTRIFLGVPYAVAPVGALRFRAAQPAGPWPGIRPAKVRPGVRAAPERVLRRPPTINYRLGALAFLSLPELDAEGAPSGNNALRDQQLALAWVRDNIGAFGGDPENVTVFGESAGAVSTCVQMVSPLGRTLARQFIMQSGTCDSAGTTSTLAEARATSARVVNALCSGRSDVVSCLRAASASDLVAVPVQTNIFDLGFLPVVNPADPLLPQSPRGAIAAGNYNKGATIIGSNARELGLFQQSGAAPVVGSIAELNAVIDARFGPLSPTVQRQYAPASDAEANETLIRLGTDLLFRCPARALARRTAGQGSQVFLYHFEEGLAFHAFELPYVFGAPNPSLGAATLVELVSEPFQTAFTSFAAVGEPRPTLDAGGGPVTDVVLGDLPPWPRYTAATDRRISVKRISEEGASLSRADCDLLESIGAVQ